MIPYKDDNPTQTLPLVTVLLIGINIAVFILQIFVEGSGQEIIFAYGAIPVNILHLHSTQPIPALMTIFTSMFMHGGLLHLAGNMLYFWIFGDNIEDSLGHIRFLVFYVFCGIVSAYAHAVVDPASTVPMIGASGAISGLLGAYILLFPSARINTLVFLGFFVQVIKIPALIVIGIWAIIQILSGFLSQGAEHHGGVAWFAHAGGFLTGLLTIKLWLPGRFRR